MMGVSTKPPVNRLTGRCRGNHSFCSLSTWKFKAEGPVESYFREHLGLDWPYGGSQPIFSQRGWGRKALFSKVSGKLFL